MTPPTAATFPELQRVCDGYLHEDFLVAYGTAAAALRAFRNDAAPADLRRFRREVKRFLARTAALEFAAVRALLSQLGSRWMPSSREELIATLAEAVEPGNRTT